MCLDIVLLKLFVMNQVVFKYHTLYSTGNATKILRSTKFFSWMNWNVWKTVSQTLVNCLFRGNTTKWNVGSAPWSAEHPGSHATGVPLHLCSQVLPSNWHSRSWLQHQLLPVVGSHHSLYSVSFVQDFHLNQVRTSKHNSVMVQ